MNALRNIWSVFKREVGGYFNGPLAYVFIFIFVFLALFFALVISSPNLIEGEDASLAVSFFQWHPWLFMILGPAVGMRLWSEEHRLGTTELLLTMPIRAWEAITAKFLAACVVMIAALALTFPIVITVDYLGDPDYGLIWSGYIGSFLVACATLAITTAVSAFTRSQVACLVIAVCICFILTLAGYPPLLTFVREVDLNWLAELLASSSLLYHANQLNQGLLRLSTLTYFVTVAAFCLFLTSVVIRSKRS